MFWLLLETDFCVKRELKTGMLLTLDNFFFFTFNYNTSLLQELFLLISVQIINKLIFIVNYYAYFKA